MAKILIPMDRYNTFRRCEAGEEGLPRNVGARVDHDMVPLLAELSKKRPAWQFVSSKFGDLSRDGTHYRYTFFTIMEDGEELGWVDTEKDWRNGGYKYRFDGPRMRLKRQRGSCTTTKDLKKAAQLILKDIYALTLSERIDSARKGTHSLLDKSVYAIQRDYRSTRDALGMCMVDFALDNWELFAKYVTPDPYTVDHMNKLRARYERNLAADVAENAKRKQLGAVVVEYGGAVHVEHDNQPGQFSQMTLETLPESLKLGVAMLKLVEPETMIDNVGLRVDAKTYYVFDGGTHGQQQP